MSDTKNNQIQISESEPVVQKKKWYSGYTDVWTQAVILSLVFFCCPGMFNALNSLGLGGDPVKGRAANLGIYICFTISSFFGPSIVNVLGPKWALVFGATGYPVISIALNGRFDLSIGLVSLMGAYLGCCAGFLFTAQGALMMSYPRTDKEKGKFITLFWSIFNVGSVIGTFMAFGTNIDDTKEGPGGGSIISEITYWIFFALQCTGILCAFFVLPIHMVTRNGVRVYEDSKEAVKKVKDSTFALLKKEIGYTCKAFSSGEIMWFVPLFFYTNFFNSYRFGTIGALFNGRTAALTGAFYWMCQIGGSYLMTSFTDSSKMSLRTRIKWSFPLVFGYLCLSWGLNAAVQYIYDVSYTNAMHMDLTTEKHTQVFKIGGEDVTVNFQQPALAMLAVILSGFADAFVQVWSYWVMGMLSKDPEMLARYAGFFKLWQNFGATISFVLSITPKSAGVDLWVNIGIVALFFLPTTIGVKKVLKKVEAEEMEDKSTESESES